MGRQLAGRNSCVKMGKGRTEMETEEKLELDEDIEVFEIIDNDEIYSSGDNVLNNAFKQQDKEIEKSIIKMVEDDATDLDEKDIEAVVSELRHLEEKLHLWREVRQNTIIRLREIADYIDSVTKSTTRSTMSPRSLSRSTPPPTPPTT